MARRARWFAVAAVLAALVSGCGDDDASTKSTSTDDPAPTTAAASDTTTTTAGGPVATGALPIGTDEIPFGEVLVDADGFALYAFTEDEGAATPTCSGDCVEKWPAVIVDDIATVELPEGVDAEVGAVERDTGESQLTIDGRPMYVMADDEPGLALCQGGEGTWYVVGLDGEPITSTDPVS